MTQVVNVNQVSTNLGKASYNKNGQSVRSVLETYGSIFSNKLTHEKIMFYETRLGKCFPEDLEKALAELAETEKFFPTIASINLKLRESRRFKSSGKSNCQHCKGTGSVVLFEKETSRSTTFSCDCEDGKNWENSLKAKFGIYIKSRDMAGDNFVERYLAKAIILKDEKEVADRLQDYWSKIF